jgi:hypothetical protein
MDAALPCVHTLAFRGFGGCSVMPSSDVNNRLPGVGISFKCQENDLPSTGVSQQPRTRRTNRALLGCGGRGVGGQQPFGPPVATTLSVESVALAKRRRDSVSER